MNNLATIGNQANTLKDALLAVSDLTCSGYLGDQVQAENVSKIGLAALFRLFAEYATDIETNLNALECQSLAQAN